MPSKTKPDTKMPEATLPEKVQEQGPILTNTNYREAYYQITFQAPRIAAAARAGQFIHLQIPQAEHLTLRRPFSIFNADPDAGTVSVIYKDIGAGTHAMSQLTPGIEANLLGPLGNGFPPPAEDEKILIVAGGYGCAATYMLAKYALATQTGVAMLGGRSAIDILVQEEFAATGFDVSISTNDGTLGHRGLVTELLQGELDKLGNQPAAIYACGPNPMLKAVGDICLARHLDAAVSLDMNMCCGVGSCFTCVVKIEADNEDGWEYIRTCKDGPVFMASTVVWDGDTPTH